MKFKTRKTHAFIEIKADESETTIFKSDQQKIDEMIINLLSVVEELAGYCDKSLSTVVQDYNDM